MCTNCGFDIQLLEMKGQTPITYTCCPRCGHHLPKPITIGTHQEGEEGNSPKVYQPIVED